MDRGQIDHGYATTIQKSQGATVERSFNLVGGNGLEELYVQLTRQKEGAWIVMIEDQLDRAADDAAIEMAPMKRMIDYSRDLVDKQGVALPEACRTDFESCRDFLNKWSHNRIEDSEIDFGLEKVSSLIESLSKSRKKANALDYEIEENREVGKEREPAIVGIEAEKEFGSNIEVGKSRETTRKSGLKLGM